MDSASMVFGLFGFIFGMSAFRKVTALEKKLKEAGILDEKSDTK